MIEIIHEKMVDRTATKDAYNKIYREHGINQHDSFYIWILNLLDAKPGSLLLDISCGQGRLVNLARERDQVAIGVDFAIEGMRIGRAAQNPASFAAADGECLPLPPACVDYVTHIGSLEHYVHPIKGAQEISRVLKPNGRAVILLPNTFGLFGNIKYVSKYGEVFDDGQPIQRYATRVTWEKLLQKGNLVIEKVVPYSEVDTPKVWKDFFWLIARPQKILRGLLALLIPLNLANHLVFVCSVNPSAGRNNG